MTISQMIITIILVIAATVLTRFLPYIIFREGKEIPGTVQYLGKVLAPAVFGLLIIYCLRNVNFAAGNHVVPEIISIAAVIALYQIKHDMLVPMAGGTVLYMILIRIM